MGNQMGEIGNHKGEIENYDCEILKFKILESELAQDKIQICRSENISKKLKEKRQSKLIYIVKGFNGTVFQFYNILNLIICLAAVIMDLARKGNFKILTLLRSENLKK